MRFFITIASCLYCASIFAQDTSGGRNTYEQHAIRSGIQQRERDRILTDIASKVNELSSAYSKTWAMLESSQDVGDIKKGMRNVNWQLLELNKKLDALLNEHDNDEAVPHSDQKKTNPDPLHANSQRRAKRRAWITILREANRTEQHIWAKLEVEMGREAKPLGGRTMTVFRQHGEGPLRKVADIESDDNGLAFVKYNLQNDDHSPSYCVFEFSGETGVLPTSERIRIR